MSFKIVNYYDHIKKEDKAMYHYPNEAQINISLPARLLVCGPSGTGKTNVILNLMKGIGIWDKVIILAKDLEEPLYKHVIEVYRKLEKKHKVQILLAISSVNDMPDLDKDFDPKENTLLICDDLICENAKDLTKLEPFWVRGRKKSITMAFLAQGYFDVPKKIRKNSNYVILKKISNPLDLGRILKEYALDISKDKMRSMYDYAMQGDAHTSFFMLDALTKKEELKYRANFDPII